MTRAASIYIDTAALQHNIHHIQKLAPHSKILAMVKANGYGHQVEVCKSIQGVHAFGVACIEEAFALKNIGVEQPIVLVEGFFSPDELPIIDEHQFEIVIHHPEQVTALKQYVAKHP
ncbi:MAG: alanine racemase, partial [Gammaproteobacteria bacterium]